MSFLSGEVIRSCTIITTTPNEVCAPIHDRMPVIVSSVDYGKWHGEEPVDPVRLLGMLKPYPAESMMAFPVDPRLGNVKNDDAALRSPFHRDATMIEKIKEPLQSVISNSDEAEDAHGDTAWTRDTTEYTNRPTRSLVATAPS